MKPAIGALAVLALAACGASFGDGAAEPLPVVTDQSTTVEPPPVTDRSQVTPDTVEFDREEPADDHRSTDRPWPGFGDETYLAGAPIVAQFVGRSLDEFEREVMAMGLGPVRIVAGDGMTEESTAELVPGRVDVVTEARDGTLVVDASVETDIGAVADFVGSPVEDLLAEASEGRTSSSRTAA